MSDIQELLQGRVLAASHRKRGEYNAALNEINRLSTEWPGNAALHVERAELIQLAEAPALSLDDAKSDLTTAVELEMDSPVALLELGHFLNAVDDDPEAAADAFARGAEIARGHLTAALIGRAKALQQIGRRAEALRCLAEAFQLRNFAPERSGDEIEGVFDEVMRTRSA